MIARKYFKGCKENMGVKDLNCESDSDNVTNDGLYHLIGIADNQFMQDLVPP